MDFKTLISFLACHYGILPGYWDIWGAYHETSLETQIAILNAMGIKVNGETEAHGAIDQIVEELQWNVPAVVSLDEGINPRISITCHENAIPSYLNWSLYEHPIGNISILAGKSIFLAEGRINGQEFLVSQCDLHVRELCQIPERVIKTLENIKKISLRLPVNLPPGYYRLLLQPSDSNNHDEIFLIVAPSVSFVTDEIKSKVGIAVQLYAVRSSNNWGIGNYSDLLKIISLFSHLKAGFVGLNPLHLLFPENPHHISPYSPSSRRFLNPWYVAVEEVPEFEEAITLLPDILQSQLLHLRNLSEVDYSAVVPLLYRAFQALYEIFKKNHLHIGTTRSEDFRRFCLERGKPLEKYGIFEALRERFQTPWWEWRIEENGTKEGLEDRAEFFRYLQFIAHEQLERVRQYAHSCHPPVKLYLDLSVSVDAGGFDVWYDRDVYTLDARIGAPPDDFNPKGQEWGVVPMIPHRLTKAHYRPFIETLRSIMRYADILRIDHVMGFFRLFWIPDGLDPIRGAYVKYPMDDMARIVALESIKNRCVVVGEDLGTVPDEVREEMARRKFLSYRVFYFEKHSDGSFKRPSEYPEDALATVTTHDLPTFKGYWIEKDIDVRTKLGMINRDFETALRKERAKDRLRILKVLSQEGFECPESKILEDNVNVYDDKNPPSKELVLSVHRYLLKTRARLASFQIDDLIGEEDQPNLPGTTVQYPCWRIRWGKTLEEITEDPDIGEFFDL